MRRWPNDPGPTEALIAFAALPHTVALLLHAGVSIFYRCECGHTWEAFDIKDDICPMRMQELEHATERRDLAERQAEEWRRLRAQGKRDADLVACAARASVE